MTQRKYRGTETKAEKKRDTDKMRGSLIKSVKDKEGGRECDRNKNRERDRETVMKNAEMRLLKIQGERFEELRPGKMKVFREMDLC